MSNKLKKKTRDLGEKIIDLVYWFFGSWWSVLFHGAWFGIWLAFDFDINNLTLAVSLEAIFIGVFLLMVSDRAEIQREAREMRQRKRDRKMAQYDIKLDEKADRQLTEIKRLQKELREEMEVVKKELRNLKKAK